MALTDSLGLFQVLDLIDNVSFIHSTRVFAWAGGLPCGVGFSGFKLHNFIGSSYEDGDIPPRDDHRSDLIHTSVSRADR